MNTLVETAGESRVPAARWRWLSFSLRSLAILVTIAAILLAIFAQEIRERWFGPRLPYKVIQNVDDLHAALRAERSVIFCDVQWSMNAALGRIRFDDFALEWQKQMPETSVQFYLLDLTDRKDDVTQEAVNVWGLNRTQGSGELAWINRGKPALYTFHTEKHSHAELAEFAQRAFGLSAVGAFPGHPKVSPENGLWYWDDEEGYSNPSSGSASR